MSERSVELFLRAKESSEKFDYLVAGVTGALAAFIGERLQPTRLGLNPSTLEVLALAMLVLSIVVGFKRIERSIMITDLNSRRLQVSELRGTLMGVINSGKTQYNTLSGEKWTPDEAVVKVEELARGAGEMQKNIDRHIAVGQRLYHWRNRLLLFGFAALVVARLLPAYV